MYTIIPMTRLGQESYQSSRSKIYQQINKHVREGKEVYEVRNKFSCITVRFPEGHILFPGTFIVADATGFEGAIVDKTNDFSKEHVVRLHLKKNIAFLDGRNCAPFCSDPFRTFYQAYGLQVDWLNDDDIRNGKLDNYELLVVPGGPDAGESYYEGLGEKGYEAIRQFVANGGKYLGSCAGSYFPLKGKKGTPESDVWLNMLEVTDEFALDYWRTGTGFVRIEYVDVEHPIVNGLALGKPSTQDVIYWEGPAFKILDDADVHVIATYQDFLASGVEPPSWSLDNNPIAQDAMKWSNPLTKERFDAHLKGYPAIIEASYGQGHMVLLSPHAEFGTCGTEHPIVDNPNFVLLMNSLYYLSSKEESSCKE